MKYNCHLCMKSATAGNSDFQSNKCGVAASLVQRSAEHCQFELTISLQLLTLLLNKIRTSVKWYCVFQTLTAVTSLAELEAELHRRLVHIQLLQWQVHGCRCVLLAAFCSPLSELLYPQQGSRGLISGVDVDLLMEATSCFPVSWAAKFHW